MRYEINTSCNFKIWNAIPGFLPDDNRNRHVASSFKSGWGGADSSKKQAIKKSLLFKIMKVLIPGGRGRRYSFNFNFIVCFNFLNGPTLLYLLNGKVYF